MSVAVAVLVLGACSDGPSTTDPSASPVSSMAPVGAASDLTPQAGTGDAGELRRRRDRDRARGHDRDPWDPHDRRCRADRVPDAGRDAQGFPALQITWQPDATAGVYEQSWSTENTKKVDTTVSDYVRSPVEWPGSDASVVSTWTEEVALQTGDSVDVDATALWLQSPDGTVVLAIAFSPAGESGSSSIEALRTITLS